MTLTVSRYYVMISPRSDNVEKVYLPRILDKLLEERLESVGAVLIAGPKWCGKTTAAEQKAF